MFKIFPFGFLCVSLTMFALIGTVSPQSTITIPDTDAAGSSSPEIKASVSELAEIKQQLVEQKIELEKLRALLMRQAEIIENLQAPARNENRPGPATQVTPSAVEKSVALDGDVETRLKSLEDRSKKTESAVDKNQLGSLGFSGDLRMQYDSIYRQLNNGPNINNPAILGNEISSRQRIRFRLRFAVSGKIGRDVFTGSFTSGGERKTDKEFEWGFRLSTGSLTNPVSPNPVLTDFYSRKPFALDRAFVAWRPQHIPGMRLIAGKFEPNWTRTEMTIDNDLQVEGIGQNFSRDIRHSIVKKISISAWQLPMLERNSVFIRNADGTVNIDESRRAGRDLGMYGAQVLTTFSISPHASLTLSVANLYFSNTGAINPIQVFGNQLQLPVTIVLPPTATEPSRTITGIATIPREFLSSGNGNLGLSSATNASVNLDGKLSSRFNLVDFIAQFEVKRYRHMPITFIFDYVRNTGTRDVIAADPAGLAVNLPNSKNEGVWAEFRLQSLRKRRNTDLDTPSPGDILVSYTYLRIEKDAVFTPFNWDDLVQQSDIQGHRIFFSYSVDPKVTLNITGLFNHRLNGLLGPFKTTPAGSLARDTIRLQFDTVFRF